MSALASARPGGVEDRTPAGTTERLYERYAGPLFGFCLKRLGSREEAEDAVQTTFLNAQRGLGRGVVPEFEAAWLYTIAANVCNTRHARSRRRPEATRDLDVLQDVLAAPERAEPDLIAALPDALARMPPVQRRALLMREWQGLTYREIATELELTEAAVETLLYRARRSLTANLERPERRGRLSRLDLGSVVAFLKSLVSGGGVKLIVAGVAVTAAVTSVGSSTRPQQHARDVTARTDAATPSPSGLRDAPMPGGRAAARALGTLRGRPAKRTVSPGGVASTLPVEPTASGDPAAGRSDATTGGTPATAAPSTSRSPTPAQPGSQPPGPQVPTPLPPVTTPAPPVSTPALPITTPQLPVSVPAPELTPTLPAPAPTLPTVTVPSVPVHAPPVSLPPLSPLP